MSGLPLIVVFVLAIIAMIVMISKLNVHPFIAIMSISVVLGLIAGIPLVNQTDADGKVTQGLANVIGAGFSGTFTSIGIVIILGALIGSILEVTGAALKLADIMIKLVGKNNPVLAVELMGWVVSIPVFCDSGFVILNPIRKAMAKRTGASSVAMTVGLAAGLHISLNKSIQKHNNLMDCQPYVKHRFRQKSERCFCISSGHRDQKGPAHFPRFLHGGSAGCIPRRRATQ